MAKHKPAAPTPPAGAPGQEPVAPSVDPTEQNELDRLNAMVNEETAAGEDVQAREQQIVADRRAERVAYYEGKVRPFVDAWGGRWKRPIHPEEARQLTNALADVGAEIIPDNGGRPGNPWLNLVGVCLAIGLPRAIAAIQDARQEQEEQANNKPTGGAGDPMLDGLNDFDAAPAKPH